jgi:hypothetical protein
MDAAQASRQGNDPRHLPSLKGRRRVHPKGYERLLYDGMRGKSMLFQSATVGEWGSDASVFISGIELPADGEHRGLTGPMQCLRQKSTNTIARNEKRWIRAM